MQHSEFFNDMNRQVENLISGHRVNDETVFISGLKIDHDRNYQIL